MCGIVGVMGVSPVNQLIYDSLLLLQHHYDIYGGLDGEYVLDLTQRLERPFFVTCHSVPGDPCVEEASILSDICYYSEAVVAQTEEDRRRLHSTYARLCVIGLPSHEHGVNTQTAPRNAD